MNSIVEEYIKLASEEWSDTNFMAAQDFLLRAWESLPDPKVSKGESYHVSQYLIMVYLELKDYKSALVWANQLQICDLERQDIGEREFWKGKVLFESGELEKAKEFFIIANKKSSGRCFIDEDKKYRELVGGKTVSLTFDSILEKADNDFLSSEFKNALELLFDALNFDEALDNPFVYLRKGQCHFELHELEKSADNLARAYMLEGEGIFDDENPKYLEFLKTKIEI